MDPWRSEGLGTGFENSMFTVCLLISTTMVPCKSHSIMLVNENINHDNIRIFVWLTLYYHLAKAKVVLRGPIMCQKSPIMCQKSPSMCQKRYYHLAKAKVVLPGHPTCAI